MKNETLWRALFAGWAVAVTALSVAPPQTLPPTFGISDLFQHGVAYAAGGACAALAWPRPRAAALAALAAIALGGMIEIAQATLTATRAGEWHDIAADAAGVAIGAAAVGFSRRAWPRGRFTDP